MKDKQAIYHLQIQNINRIMNDYKHGRISEENTIKQINKVLNIKGVWLIISATNRGTERNKADFYPTPISVIEKFLQHHKLKESIILEPCAGNGHFSKTIKNLYPNSIIDQIEIRDEEKENLSQYGSIYIGNYLDSEKEKDYGTIITNPPYSLALEFVEHSLKTYPEAEVIMLLRLAFLESKKRYSFWQQHPVSKLYILSERPSFTGKGTDATAYAWFVWNNEKNQEIKVI